MCRVRRQAPGFRDHAQIAFLLTSGTWNLKPDMRVLFLTPNPIEAANTRYRAYQFLPYLKSRGVECEIAPFVSSELFHHLYNRGRIIRKTAGIARSVLGRLVEVIRVRRFDVVCVSREAMLFGPPVIEWLVSKVAGCPMVFDF